MSGHSFPPTLDAHAHIAYTHSDADLVDAGAILAMTLSLDEAAQAVGRNDARVLWGVGCHPNDVTAQEHFDVHSFMELTRHTPIVGEVGLDARSPVPLEAQGKVFRSILQVVADHPRIVSIHSNHTTREVMEELSRKPIACPVLHWWNGSDARTKAAVDLGCSFSIHSAIANYSRFPKFVPATRILLETDQGYDEAPSLIPGRIALTEKTVSGKYQISSEELRRLTWGNLRRLVEETETGGLISESFRKLLENK